jgi:predicted amidohydrolase
MITKIGLFHFVDNYDLPVSSLRDALSACSEDVRGSLIVLPEAFNYGRSYSRDPGHAPKIARTAAACELAVLSHNYGAIFVAGLLDLPRNSAYLISGMGEPVLMCHKKTGDSTNRVYNSDWWQPCAADSGTDPYNFEDACIGVLICNETEYYVPRLAQELDRRAGTRRKVICIPAHMPSGYLEGTLDFAPWTGKYVVFANSRPWPDGTRSFIANKAGKRAPESKGSGRFFLKTWDELDSLGS